MSRRRHNKVNYRVNSGRYTYMEDVDGAVDCGLYKNEKEIPRISEILYDDGKIGYIGKEKLKSFEHGDRIATIYGSGYGNVAVMGSNEKLCFFQRKGGGDLYNRLPRKTKKKLKNEALVRYHAKVKPVITNAYADAFPEEFAIDK